MGQVQEIRLLVRHCAAATALICLAHPAATQEYETQRLSIEDVLVDGDGEGPDAAVSGDIAVIGSDGVDGVGAAYVFQRAGHTWTFAQKLQPRGPDACSRFGVSVAVDGDVIVVGDDGFSTAEQPEIVGAAFVFRRVGGVWVRDGVLQPRDAHPAAEFGHEVAISGDWAFVGRRGDGTADAFRWTGVEWQREQELVPRDDALPDAGWFGHSISVHAGVAVIGAPHADGRVADAGAAYVFRLKDGLWVEDAKLFAPNGQPADALGWSVSAGAERVLVGSSPQQVLHDDVHAYLFRNTAGAWSFEQEFVHGLYGCTVALAGDTALVASYPVVASYRWSGEVWKPAGHVVASDGSAPLHLSMTDGVAVGTFGEHAHVFYVDADPWQSVGHGLDGVSGQPVLVGTGELTGGSALQIRLENAAANAPTALFAALWVLNAPLKGGVLVPNPTVVVFGLGTDARGQLQVNGTWPEGIPSGWSFFFQEWIVDAQGVAGFSASNGLQGISQ